VNDVWSKKSSLLESKPKSSQLFDRNKCISILCILRPKRTALQLCHSFALIIGSRKRPRRPTHSSARSISNSIYLANRSYLGFFISMPVSARKSPDVWLTNHASRIVETWGHGGHPSGTDFRRRQPGTLDISGRRNSSQFGACDRERPLETVHQRHFHRFIRSVCFPSGDQHILQLGTPFSTHPHNH
jgi:hypothetical protein